MSRCIVTQNITEPNTIKSMDACACACLSRIGPTGEFRCARVGAERVPVCAWVCAGLSASQECWSAEGAAHREHNFQYGGVRELPLIQGGAAIRVHSPPLHAHSKYNLILISVSFEKLFRRL